jgi:hypothetical protein
MMGPIAKAVTENGDYWRNWIPAAAPTQTRVNGVRQNRIARSLSDALWRQREFYERQERDDIFRNDMCLKYGGVWITDV